MEKLLILSLVVVLTSCVTTREEDRTSERSRDKMVPHAGGPMKTILGKPDQAGLANGLSVTSLEGIITGVIGEDSKLAQSADDPNRDDNGVNSKTLGTLQSAFEDSTGLSRDELTGHARLIFEDLGSILEEIQSGTVPAEAPAGTHKECIDAYSEKVAWHQENNGSVPAIFGKITEYVLTPVPNSEYWVGAIDLCTWNGAVNYYFNISFLNKDKNSLTLVKPPFSEIIASLTDDPAGTLDDEILLSTFNFKLHANNKGEGNDEGAVIYKNVFKKGVFYPANDKIYAELEKDCFDTFYVDRPTGVKAVDLADQFGYCMGRCDGRVLNTAS